MLLQEILMILGVLKATEKHTELLEKRLIIKVIVAC